LSLPTSSISGSRPKTPRHSSRSTHRASGFLLTTEGINGTVASERDAIHVSSLYRIAITRTGPHGALHRAELNLSPSSATLAALTPK
jgi:hypothetical protein